MRRQTIVTALVVAMVAIAGCGGSVSPGDGGSGEGTITMYVSDQPSAIDDFAHLNVTITSIAAHRVDANDSANESGWVEQEIDNVTVDLTELQGANASQLGAIPAPNGSYDKTFVHVSEVDGTLTNGETTDVKLPSSKLHINENFTVGNGEEVDFVFDITVVKRGNSGSYNIQPVAGESGTDQAIREKPGAKRGAGGNGANGGDGDGDATTTPAGTETATPTDGAASLEFYVSDERNAIDEFDHLNVTIDRVGVHRADPGANESPWIEHSVDNRTVDLTELQGANATSLGVLNVSNGTYDKTFVYVDEVNGTLTDGEHPDVKLPSSKIQLNSEFTVGDGEEVDYVFDITVVKRGNSGSYNVKPVASESGTGEQVEIDPEDDENETETEEPAALSLSLDGNATPGENVTVSVTRNGSAVSGAELSLDGEAVGETNANGTLVVTVPADAEALELEAERGDAEGEATFPVQENTETATETQTETATGTEALAGPAFAAR